MQEKDTERERAKNHHDTTRNWRFSVNIININSTDQVLSSKEIFFPNQ